MPLPQDSALYDEIVKALHPVGVAALTGGFTWLAMRRKNSADAKAVLEGILNARMKLVIDAYETRIQDLNNEVSALRLRDDRREAEIIALRQALDRKTEQVLDLVGGNPADAHRTVAFVELPAPPENEK